MKYNSLGCSGLQLNILKISKLHGFNHKTHNYLVFCLNITVIFLVHREIKGCKREGALEPESPIFKFQLIHL